MLQKSASCSRAIYSDNGSTAFSPSQTRTAVAIWYSERGAAARFTMTRSKRPAISEMSWKPTSPAHSLTSYSRSPIGPPSEALSGRSATSLIGTRDFSLPPCSPPRSLTHSIRTISLRIGVVLSSKRTSELKNGTPEANCPWAPEEASLTHPRSGYPLDGCVPAEPSSVSPNVATLTATSTLNTRVMPKKIPGFQGLAPDHTGCSS